MSLVELMQSRRQELETLTIAEVDAAVSQAMGQSERTTARRYLRLFRWLLTAACVTCLVWLYPQITFFIKIWQYARESAPSNAAEIGVIGGADGPTAIITAYNPTNSLSCFLQVGVPLLLLIVCVVLAVNVWRLEK